MSKYHNFMVRMTREREKNEKRRKERGQGEGKGSRGEAEKKRRGRERGGRREGEERSGRGVKKRQERRGKGRGEGEKKRGEGKTAPVSKSAPSFSWWHVIVVLVSDLFYLNLMLFMLLLTASFATDQTRAWARAVAVSLFSLTYQRPSLSPPPTQRSGACSTWPCVPFPRAAIFSSRSVQPHRPW